MLIPGQIYFNLVRIQVNAAAQRLNLVRQQRLSFILATNEVDLLVYSSVIKVNLQNEPLFAWRHPHLKLSWLGEEAGTPEARDGTVPDPTLLIPRWSFCRGSSWLSSFGGGETNSKIN
jgi:hypothetical protein